MEAELIRPLRGADRHRALQIINAAAERYRGVIPEDRWRDPYMPGEEFDQERRAGVDFWVLEEEGVVLGLMGVQRVKDRDLIRHAYVDPAAQGRGVGGRLLEFLRARSDRPMLIGTWAAASWAIGFYERHGFVIAGPATARALLNTYWSIPDRQIDTSVVLVGPD